LIPVQEVAKLRNALPFWLSLTFVPLIPLVVAIGGIGFLILPIYTWGLYSLLDRIEGLNLENADPETPVEQLFWYKLITQIWLPVQVVIVFGSIWYATQSGELVWWEKALFMFGVGVSSGTVGMVYGHELMHQQGRLERALGDGLLAITLYGHFRSEHLLVHHRYVGTPRDPATARYNQGFHRFFAQVLPRSLASSWRAEKAMLARKGLGALHRSNPFYRYVALELIFLAVAFSIGGWEGVLLFAFQAGVAIWQLELVNYVEHYGLTRKYLGDGKYEHVMPHHSWNSAHKASNWLLINLQRHSDHHFKPNRRYPLLQNYGVDQAPQLSHGYPVMTAIAMVPPVWRRLMNPRVRKWREAYYPDILDWSAYKAGSNPMPDGAS
jgi:alkane 1-monooxygenase